MFKAIYRVLKQRKNTCFLKRATKQTNKPIQKDGLIKKTHPLYARLISVWSSNL